MISHVGDYLLLLLKIYCENIYISLEITVSYASTTHNIEFVTNIIISFLTTLQVHQSFPLRTLVGLFVIGLTYMGWTI